MPAEDSRRSHWSAKETFYVKPYLAVAPFHMPRKSLIRSSTSLRRNLSRLNWGFANCSYNHPALGCKETGHLKFISPLPPPLRSQLSECHWTICSAYGFPGKYLSYLTLVGPWSSCRIKINELALQLEKWLLLCVWAVDIGSNVSRQWTPFHRGMPDRKRVALFVSIAYTLRHFVSSDRFITDKRHKI